MSFIRYRQPIVTRLSPHQGNRQYLVPNVPPLGPELVPEPYFNNWSGAANPDNTPDGWTLTLQTPTDYFEPGASAGPTISIDGFRMRQVLANASLTSDGALPEIGATYRVQWLVSAEVSGQGRVDLAGSAGVILAGAAGHQGLAEIVAVDQTPIVIRRHSDGTDKTYSFLSIRKVQSK